MTRTSGMRRQNAEPDNCEGNHAKATGTCVTHTTHRRRRTIDTPKRTSPNAIDAETQRREAHQTQAGANVARTQRVEPDPDLHCGCGNAGQSRTQHRINTYTRLWQGNVESNGHDERGHKTSCDITTRTHAARQRGRVQSLFSREDPAWRATWR